MGVKHTVRLTRSQAEDRYVRVKLARKEQGIRAKATLLTDAQLEDKLELWNDQANDGEGFENYQIARD